MKIEGENMSRFDFITGSVELIDFIKPLWEKLNKYHEVKSIYFSDKYKNNTFDKRKSKFVSNNNLKVRIDLIKDIEKNLYIGYCISTIDIDQIGEIDSLFIEEEYRKYGLGDQLMNKSVEWLDLNKVKMKVISVAEGNEAVLEFYKRYGFHRRRIILEQIIE